MLLLLGVVNVNRKEASAMRGIGDWLDRLGAARTNRRQAGLLGALLLTAHSVAEPASGGRKRRGAKPGASRGRRRCKRGAVWCPACGGLCLTPDVPCSNDLCAGEPCNQTTCRPGEYCCNESCSRCVPRGRGCSRELCPPNPPGGEPCGTTRCGPGEFCCNPSCGVCAPLGGGCAAVYCEPGPHPEPGPAPDPGGEHCGRAVCPRGQVCCNASCGVCTPPGMACIMIACVDEAAG